MNKTLNETMQNYGRAKSLMNGPSVPVHVPRPQIVESLKRVEMADAKSSVQRRQKRFFDSAQAMSRFEKGPIRSHIDLQNVTPFQQTGAFDHNAFMDHIFTSAATYQSEVALTGYSFASSPAEIKHFLSQHAFLMEVLQEARIAATHSFGAETSLMLELLVDAEGEVQGRLFCSIQSSLAVNDALQCRQVFDEKYWLDASSRARGHLNFDVA